MIPKEAQAKQETCAKCGLGKAAHSYAPRSDGVLNFKGCKKFIPNNHTYQEKPKTLGADAGDDLSLGVNNQETCANCGHEEYHHGAMGCMNTKPNFEGDEPIEECECKKFIPNNPIDNSIKNLKEIGLIPNNHSPQNAKEIATLEVYSGSNPDVEDNNQETLGDKIQNTHPDGYPSKKGLAVEDVKEFVRQVLDDCDKKFTSVHDFGVVENIIKKRAGKELI